MKYISAYINASGGLFNAQKSAHLLGAALFTKNKRCRQTKPLYADTIIKLKVACSHNHFSPEQMLPHDSYLINIAPPEAAQLQKPKNTFLDEIERYQQLAVILANYYPAIHLGKITTKYCPLRITDYLNCALQNSGGVKVAIDNSADQGTNLGYRFDHLATITEYIDANSHASPLGVAEIGWDCFQYIMQYLGFNHIPRALETTNSDIWVDEIKQLKEWVK